MPLNLFRAAISYNSRKQKSPGGNYSAGAVAFLYSFERSRKSHSSNSLFGIGGEKEKNRNQIPLYHNYGSFMVAEAGLEPATFGL